MTKSVCADCGKKLVKHFGFWHHKSQLDLIKCSEGHQ